MAGSDPIPLTHGTVLGQVTKSSVRIWARTSDPGEFRVRYGMAEDRLLSTSAAGTTRPGRDNTGSLTLTDL